MKNKKKTNNNTKKEKMEPTNKTLNG